MQNQFESWLVQNRCTLKCNFIHMLRFSTSSFPVCLATQTTLVISSVVKNHLYLPCSTCVTISVFLTDSATCKPISAESYITVSAHSNVMAHVQVSTLLVGSPTAAVWGYYANVLGSLEKYFHFLVLTNLALPVTNYTWIVYIIRRAVSFNSIVNIILFSPIL